MFPAPRTPARRPAPTTIPLQVERLDERTLPSTAAPRAHLVEEWRNTSAESRHWDQDAATVPARVPAALAPPPALTARALDLLVDRLQQMPAPPPAVVAAMEHVLAEGPEMLKASGAVAAGPVFHELLEMSGMWPIFRGLTDTMIRHVLTRQGGQVLAYLLDQDARAAAPPVPVLAAAAVPPGAPPAPAEARTEAGLQVPAGGPESRPLTARPTGPEVPTPEMPLAPGWEGLAFDAGIALPGLRAAPAEAPAELPPVQFLPQEGQPWVPVAGFLAVDPPRPEPPPAPAREALPLPLPAPLAAPEPANAWMLLVGSLTPLVVPCRDEGTTTTENPKKRRKKKKGGRPAPRLRAGDVSNSRGVV